MHRITVALVTSAAVLSASAAFAADMSVRRAPPPVAPLLPPPVLTWDWTGCYVGGFIGGAWGGSVEATEAASTGGAIPAGALYNAPFGASYSYDLDSSFIGGGTLGCNLQVGTFVFGLEGEAGYLRLEGSAIDPNSGVLYGSDTLDSTKVGDWYGVIAARLGVTFGPTLVYLKGGAAFIKASSTIVDNCVIAPCGPSTLAATGSTDEVTWAIGAGVEYGFTPNWSVKAEYLHIGLDRDYSVCGPGGGTAAGSTFCSIHNIDGIHTVKVGVNFRFGPFGGVGARY
jgi:outer membrane immunogenic protein